MFTVDLPDSRERFRLPDFDGSVSTLEYLVQTLEGFEQRHDRKRLEEVREQHEKLCSLFTSDLPDLLRAKLLADITQAENELKALEARLAGGLSGQLRAINRQLVDLARRSVQARRVLRSEEESLERKAIAVRRAVSSIVCEFEPYQMGSQTQMRLARVRFVPHLGEEVCLDAPKLEPPATHHQSAMP